MTAHATTGSIGIAAFTRSILAALVVVALLATLTAGSASAASKGCSVKNKATGRTYSTLQAAMNAAKPRATLLVRGACLGTTVIRKSVSIHGVKGERWGAPRLVAHHLRAPLVTIRSGATVELASLTLRGGRGVFNQGRAMLRDVAIGARDTNRHFAMGILNTGVLRLVGDSSVQATRGVVNRGHLTIGGTSTIRWNEGSVRNTGTVIMQGRSHIGGNHAPWHSGLGASGVAIVNRGRFVMNQDSSLADQAQGGDGAIVNHGTLVMNDRASIHDNDGGGDYLAPEGRGGGVRNHGRLVMRDNSSIHHNLARLGFVCACEDPVGKGGGVYNTGTLVMRGAASIYGNAAEYADHHLPGGQDPDWNIPEAGPGRGGGIISGPRGTLIGVRCGPGGNVYDNLPDDCYFQE